MQSKIFDSQGKLLFHLDRVDKWLKGENVPPILVEINPTNLCNQNCIWCRFHDVHRKEELDKDILKKLLNDFSRMDVKAINWSGGGEPLVYPDIDSMFKLVHDLGLQQGIFTNGQALTEKFSDIMLRTFEWIRFSVDTATAETYKKTHRVDTFNQVINNIKGLVEKKEEIGSSTTIGICMNIYYSNYHEISKLCELSRSLGVNYFQVRPTLMGHSKEQIPYSWWESHVYSELEKIRKMNTKDFEVYVSDYKFDDLKNLANRGYKKCYGTQFCPVIDADGSVMICIYFLKNPDFILGNLHNNSFEEIWNSGWQKK